MQQPLSILISGGAGFIGRACAREFTGRGQRVVVLDDLSAGDREELMRLAPRSEFLQVDARSSEQLSRVLRDHGPFQYFLHLAGRVGVPTVLEDPELCREVTRDLVRSLTAAFLRLPAGHRPRLLAASTSEVYQDASGCLAESAPLRSIDGQGRWAYAGSRVEAEQALDRAGLVDRLGRAPIHLRFFNVTGPGHRADSGMVLPRFVWAALKGQPLPVHGDGSQERTFAHVDDIARDLADLTELDAAPAGPLNLGGCAHVTVLELAQTVLRLAERDIDHIRFLDPRTIHPTFEEIRCRKPDLARAMHLGLGGGHRPLRDLVQQMLDQAVALDSPSSLVPCASPASSPV